MDKRISDLESQLSIASDDIFAVVDTSVGVTKKVTFSNLKENLPAASTSTNNNSYLVPINITCQDGVDVYLTSSLYLTTSMFKLDWSGPTGDMNMYLPDATNPINKYRTIRFITNNSYSTSTRTELQPSTTQTLDGGLGSDGKYTINKAYEGIMVWSDGTEWYRVQTKA